MKFLASKQGKRARAFLILSFCAVVFFGFAALSASAYQEKYADRIHPGVTIQDLEVAGMSKEQAFQTLDNKADEALKDGLRFSYQGNIVVLPVILRKADGTHGHQFIDFNFKQAVDDAYTKGKEGSAPEKVLEGIKLFVFSTDVPLETRVDESALEKELKNKLANVFVAPQDAKLDFEISKTGKAIVTVQSEQQGSALDLLFLSNTLKSQAKDLNFIAVQVNPKALYPSLSSKDVEPLISQAESWLKRAPLKLVGEGKTWSIDEKMLSRWITASSSNAGAVLTLDSKVAKSDFDALMKGILQEPKNGKLVLEGEQVKEFIAPQQGIILNLQASLERVEQSLGRGATSTDLELRRETPVIEGTDAERLGIREVVGLGRSDFSGSPTNRRKNIALGASRLNGIILAPDEEFSMLKALGTIDQKHGWLPELVIKEGKTVPEDGGGLCQIGTTAFRAALDSGLLITQRRNHSYRVRYYEPAGTDATIYDPQPDFRFKNDTGNSVLITTAIREDEVVFTFWGTKDGRVVGEIKPRIFNIVPPPPKKTIPTTDLPVGRTKCTESAHAGADASLDYVVTYANGEVKKETFNSHYVPWGAVCLVGVEKMPEEGAASGVVN